MYVCVVAKGCWLIEREEHRTVNESEGVYVCVHQILYLLIPNS
jgi:hypothetical protein